MKVLFLITVMVLAVFTLSGCKDKPAQAAPSSQAAAMTGDMQMASVETASDTEQTTCPVMGGAINKEIFTEYQGKKVYFCCPACKPDFEKNPEQYIRKLPQFKK